jgi:hypothetical protein
MGAASTVSSRWHIVSRYIIDLSELDITTFDIESKHLCTETSRTTFQREITCALRVYIHRSPLIQMAPTIARLRRYFLFYALRFFNKTHHDGRINTRPTRISARFQLPSPSHHQSHAPFFPGQINKPALAVCCPTPHSTQNSIHLSPSE